MSETPNTVAQLLEGIRKGRVARQVRLFAAQGLLPVSRDDLLRLQLNLTMDPDAELAQTARRSVKEEPVELITEWLAASDLDALELDLVARVRREPAVWERVARSRKVADDTLRVLARHGGASIQDIVITNQTRVLGCLDLLDDLRANPQVTQVVLRRVREFEEEFIAKAVAAAQRDQDLEPSPPGPGLAEALEDLKKIGGHVPDEDELQAPSGEDDLAPDDEGESFGGGSRGAFVRLLSLNTHEKIMVALKGSREERSILVNSRNRLVARAVLSSPKLTDGDVEKFAASRSVSDEIIRGIAQNPRWLRQYGVIHALAQNPKTPPRISLGVLPRLSVRDLKRLSTNRNISAAVRVQAQRLLSRRR